MVSTKSTQTPVSQTAPWARAVTREISRPVFPELLPAFRPYLLALILFAAAATALSVGDAAMQRLGLSWPLVSLLVVAASASLWGVRPALLVLVLSAGYGVTYLHLQPALLHAPLTWQTALVRVALFAACGGAATGLIDRTRRLHVKAETRRGVVEALQSMTLPTALAHAVGYDLSGLHKPARAEEEVGGDFYDFYPTGTGHYCLLVGDVMGKGKEAAASTALLRYAVRAFCSTGAGPAEIVTRLNTLIETQGLPFETATLFVGLLNPRTGALSYANAGHEPPLLRRAGGGEEVLPPTGPLLGFGLDAVYTEETLALDTDDALLLLTDGVTEARNEVGEFLGSAGAWWLLRTALKAPSAHTALVLLDRGLTDYTGAHPQSDDIALLLLRRT